MRGRIVAVSVSPAHSFSKPSAESVTLVAGHGVLGDAHYGTTVKHRSRVAQDPNQPNLRQVHLIHSELFQELSGHGYVVAPGELGENLTTHGIDLLALPVDTELTIGDAAVVRLTGLRNPCAQIDRFQTGLLNAVLDRAPDGRLIRKTGVMGIVVVGGVIRRGDTVTVRLPPMPYKALDRV